MHGKGYGRHPQRFAVGVHGQQAMEAGDLNALRRDVLDAGLPSRAAARDRQVVAKDIGRTHAREDAHVELAVCRICLRSEGKPYLLVWTVA
jgi:hypothetical protein